MGQFYARNKKTHIIENDDREWVKRFYDLSLMLKYDRSQRGSHKRDSVPSPRN